MKRPGQLSTAERRIMKEENIKMNTELTPTKKQIISLLDAWIRQRPGLEYCNYGDPTSYRAELRQITKDLHDARKLLRAVELSSITAPELVEAFRAFCGRLEIKDAGNGEYRLDYCTGQYWPTEYRKAAAAVLAQALWDYYRFDYTGNNVGDKIRAAFRRMFGNGIARRWFN
jgi:hypothetical protein